MTTRVSIDKETYQKAKIRHYKVRFNFISMQERDRFIKQYFVNIKDNFTQEVKYYFKIDTLLEEDRKLSNEARIKNRLSKVNCFEFSGVKGFSLYINMHNSIDFNGVAIGGNGYNLFKEIVNKEPYVKFLVSYTDEDNSTGEFDDTEFRPKIDYEKIAREREKQFETVTDEKYLHHVEILCNNTEERRYLLLKLFNEVTPNRFEFKVKDLIKPPLEYMYAKQDFDNFSRELRWRKDNWDAFRFYLPDGIRIKPIGEIGFKFSLYTTGGNGYPVWKKIVTSNPNIEFIDRFITPDNRSLVFDNRTFTSEEIEIVEDTPEGRLASAMKLLDDLSQDQISEVEDQELMLQQKGYKLKKVVKTYYLARNNDIVVITHEL